MVLKKHKYLTKKESTKMMEDISYCLTVIFVVHMLMHTMDDQVDILDEAVIKLSLYITLGIALYHLIIKRFISTLFRSEKRKKN